MTLQRNKPSSTRELKVRNTWRVCGQEETVRHAAASKYRRADSALLRRAEALVFGIRARFAWQRHRRSQRTVEPGRAGLFHEGWPAPTDLARRAKARADRACLVGCFQPAKNTGRADVWVVELDGGWQRLYLMPQQEGLVLPVAGLAGLLSPSARHFFSHPIVEFLVFRGFQSVLGVPCYLFIVIWLNGLCSHMDRRESQRRTKQRRGFSMIKVWYLRCCPQATCRNAGIRRTYLHYYLPCKLRPLGH